MRDAYLGPERRHNNRPVAGDVRTCDRCGGTMRFDEHLTVPAQGTVRWQPAWVCRESTCLTSLFVRAADRLAS